MKCIREKCTGVARSDADHGLCDRHRVSERNRLGLVKVPVAPIREHVDALRRAGLGYVRIGQLAGVAPVVVRGVYVNKNMFRKNAQAIMSVPPPELESFTDQHKVSVLGTRRRLRALVALGYTNKQLAEAMGYANVTLHGPLYGFGSVTVATARTVRDLFGRLQMVPPPDTAAAKWARGRAERNGWAPPFAWDEENIDDPDAVPNVGEKRHVTIVENYRDLRSLGFSEEDVARKLNLKRSYLESLRRKAS